MARQRSQGSGSVRNVCTRWQTAYDWGLHSFVTCTLMNGSRVLPLCLLVQTQDISPRLGFTPQPRIKVSCSSKNQLYFLCFLSWELLLHVVLEAGDGSGEHLAQHQQTASHKSKFISTDIKTFDMGLAGVINVYQAERLNGAQGRNSPQLQPCLPPVFLSPSWHLALNEPVNINGKEY